MATLDEITDRFRAAVGADSGLDRSVKFDLKGEGVIRLDEGMVDNQDLPAELTIYVSRSDLEDLGKGRLDPMSAVMTGRLKFSDMSLAMQLQSQLQALFSRAL